jgi:hypothetical protein
LVNELISRADTHRKRAAKVNRIAKLLAESVDKVGYQKSLATRKIEDALNELDKKVVIKSTKNLGDLNHDQVKQFMLLRGHSKRPRNFELQKVQAKQDKEHLIPHLSPSHEGKRQ